MCSSGPDSTTGLLLRFAATGNTQDFRAIHDRYRPIVLGWAIRCGFTREEAEDIAQETLLRVADNADRFDPKRGSTSAWLLSIARRCLQDAARSHQRERNRQTLPESRWAELAGHDDLAARWEQECRQTVLARAVDGLRRSTRCDEKTIAAFIRFALQEESAQSIARDLGLSVEQVYVAKSRCVDHIRPLLERLQAEYELE
ncbi:MAG: sigma-70 family RNA polymerase sigma factor [Planctomycetota bacterium]